ncbi:MAG: chromate transporter [Planctomycetia bacterium]
MSTAPTGETAEAACQPPRLSLGALFLRFARFGVLGFGGPIAQIALLQKELVEEQRWVSLPRFQRALAVYQALPGPEASELCTWFGMLARGRAGALVAGLGFLLPGLALMLALAWLYVHADLATHVSPGALLGLSAAVLALVVRGVTRIGRHALGRPAWWLVAVAALLGVLAGLSSWWLLGGAALLGTLARFLPDAPAPADGTPRRILRVPGWLAAPLMLPLLVGAAWLVGMAVLGWGTPPGSGPAAPAAAGPLGAAPGPGALFLLGLQAGLLTFGGAYTAIPFVRDAAVLRGAWLRDSTFLDGLALAGVLPGPLVLFTAFVGVLAAGLPGGLAITAGVFLPAFGFTLLGHGLLERLVALRPLHDLLDAVTAAVVGLVAATALRLLQAQLTTPWAWLIFGVALFLLARWRARWAAPATLILSSLLGLLA